ncbi:MAG: pyrroline-5-carboxylate reductase [Patescibacteria group bacterium]
MKNKTKQIKLGIIGTGVMGTIFINRLLKTKTLFKNQILVNDNSPENIKKVNKNYGVKGTLDKKKLIEKANIILLAVKPQNFKNLTIEIKKYIKPNKKLLVLSIMAGVDIKNIQKLLGFKKVVRVMPNLPAKIGQGISVWQASPEVSQSQKREAKIILQSLGQELEVKDEKIIDKATAISGSGPAYVFLFQEMMAIASQKLGLPQKIAHKLVEQTIKGSINLQKKLNVSPEILRQQVTSKGGTTAQAINIFEKHKTQNIFTKALRAAYKRSQELKKL